MKLKRCRRQIIVVLAICVAIGTIFVTPTGKAAMAAMMKRDLPIYCVKKENNVVSLSFDAAWGNC